MCGDIYNPVLYPIFFCILPAALNASADFKLTLPFPFVPAMWIALREFCGLPKNLSVINIDYLSKRKHV